MRVENEGRTLCRNHRGRIASVGRAQEKRRSQWWILVLAVVTAAVIVVAGILPAFRHEPLCAAKRRRWPCLR